MNEMYFQVASPADFGSVIQIVLEAVRERSGGVLCLRGDLGAGKTTFVQELAKQLGITEPVTSPTFGIMKSYEVEDNFALTNLVHIDAYRIEDISEAGPLRLEELWQQPNNLICIEWPERIESILPKNRINILITITEGENREVTVRV